MRANTETIYEHILPSGRGIRFVAIDTALTLEITERAAGSLPKGETPNPIVLQQEVSKETIATCLRGVTHRPLVIQMQPGDGDKPPTPDLEATLLAARDPEKNAWRQLSYQALTVDGPDHMTAVLNDPRDWRGAIDRINKASAGGAILDDPFRAARSIRTG